MQQTTEERVRNLEVTVTGLQSLPDDVKELRVRMGGVERRLVSVESQILQLRSEMREGFLAITRDLTEQIDLNWQRTRALFEEVIDRIKTIGER